MEYGQTDWDMAGQVKRAFCWEAKKLFYKLHIPAGILVGVFAVIGILPRAACQFLGGHAFIAVVLVNTGLVLALTIGLVLPTTFLLTSYADPMYPMEKLGDLQERAILLARLLLGMALLAAVILAGHLASVLMGKFATESVRWFQFDFELGFWKMVVRCGLMQPLAALWIFLRRLERHREYQYVRSFVLGLFLNEVIQVAAELQFLHSAPGKEPPAWILEGVWYLVMLGSAGVLFRLSLAVTPDSP